jgi:hypothetical protein
MRSLLYDAPTKYFISKASWRYHGYMSLRILACCPPSYPVEKRFRHGRRDRGRA